MKWFTVTLRGGSRALVNLDRVLCAVEHEFEQGIFTLFLTDNKKLVCQGTFNPQ